MKITLSVQDWHNVRGGMSGIANSPLPLWAISDARREIDAKLEQYPVYSEQDAEMNLSLVASALTFSLRNEPLPLEEMLTSFFEGIREWNREENAGDWSDRDDYAWTMIIPFNVMTASALLDGKPFNEQLKGLHDLELAYDTGCG